MLQAVRWHCPLSQLAPGLLTTRIYGGYAANADGSHGGSNAGCLSPEPYSYESGFAVQRAIVAQIDGADDGYSGPLDYKGDGTGHAPWFDWTVSLGQRRRASQ